jgi:hypothetical protein
LTECLIEPTAVVSAPGSAMGNSAGGSASTVTMRGASGRAVEAGLHHPVEADDAIAESVLPLAATDGEPERAVRHGGRESAWYQRPAFG